MHMYMHIFACMHRYIHIHIYVYVYLYIYAYIYIIGIVFSFLNRALSAKETYNRMQLTFPKLAVFSRVCGLASCE